MSSIATVEFRKAFHDVAKEHDVASVPFMLAGVAGVADLNQTDGIHPNPKGAKRVAENILTGLEPLLEE